MAESDPIVSANGLEAMASAYLNGHEARNPLASPLFGDFSNFPPMLVQVGSNEILLDDARRFADKATAAGIDITLDVWEEMIHVWHSFSLMLPEGRKAIAQAGNYLAKKLV